MRRYSFKQILALSFSRTGSILFVPFRIKKWIAFCIIVVLAGYFGGSNLSLNLDLNNDKSQQANVKQQRACSTQNFANVPDVEDIKQNIKDNLKNLTENVSFLIFLSTTIFLFVISALIWLLLRARFEFVFLESLVKKDPSFKVPYNKNKHLGNSYFGWNVVFGLCSFLIIGSLVALIFLNSGIDLKMDNFSVKQAFFDSMPYSLLLILFVFVLLVVRVFSSDFISALMYSQNINVKKAWSVFLKEAGRNKLGVLSYLFLKLVLSIVAFFGGIVIALIALVFFLLTGGLVGLLGYLIYYLFPLGVKWVALIILILLGTPVYVYLILLTSSFFVPIFIFFKLYPMYFVESLDEKFIFFNPEKEKLYTEEEYAKFYKPMRLFFAAVILSIICAISFIATAISGQMSAFSSTSLQQSQSKIGQAAMSTVRGSSSGKDKIYLHNGRIIEATIVEEDEDNLYLRIEGGTSVIGKDTIKTVKRSK